MKKTGALWASECLGWMINFQGRVKNHLSYRDGYLSFCMLVAQMVNNLPAMQETWVRSLTPWRSPGEGNGCLLQYSCLENPWTEKPGRLQSMGSQRVAKSRRRLSNRHFHFFSPWGQRTRMIWEMEGEKEQAGWMKCQFILSGAKKTQQLKTIIRKPWDNCEIFISLERHSWEWLHGSGLNVEWCGNSGKQFGSSSKC